MRFAKFFFVLLFSAVFIVTLFKVLFFVLMAGLVFGGVFLASRAFGYRRFGHHPQWAPNYGPGAPSVSFGSEQSPFEQPLNPNWQKRPAGPAYGRRIEVL